MLTVTSNLMSGAESYVAYKMSDRSIKHTYSRLVSVPYLPLCLSIYLPRCLSVQCHLFIFTNLHCPKCLSIRACVSLYLFVWHICACVCAYLFLCSNLPVCLPICTPISQCILSTIHPSIRRTAPMYGCMCLLCCLICVRCIALCAGGGGLVARRRLTCDHHPLTVL